MSTQPTSSQGDGIAALTAGQKALLQRYGFDATTFARLQAELAEGRFEADRNRVAGPVAPPETGDILPWPEANQVEGQAVAQMGKQAIAAGRVAVAILNGGMATRFGGRVKGVVEVVDGLSFLALKLRNIAQAAQQLNAPIHVFLMNSFATDKDTREHLQQHNNFGLPAHRLHIVTQNISLRLTPEGRIFRSPEGEVSFYAPGHGDLLGALATDPGFSAFVKGGGNMVTVSNVDNLGATLEPRVIGTHLKHNKAVTVEVASREGGDTGGAPVRMRGKVEILEGFRFPKTFDTQSLPVFNTNSFVLSVGAVRSDHPLTWFRADKKVGDAPVVQFERLLGEITSFVPSAFLQVPREGGEGRFMPVKTPDDIVAVRPLVKARFGL